VPSTFTIKREGVCAGGNHHIITVTVGAKVRTFHVDTDFLRAPVTDAEIENALRVIMRAGIAQLTLPQAAAKLTTGFNMVID
jgi:hypothetical protein